MDASGEESETYGSHMLLRCVRDAPEERADDVRDGMGVTGARYTRMAAEGYLKSTPVEHGLFPRAEQCFPVLRMGRDASSVLFPRQTRQTATSRDRDGHRHPQALPRPRLRYEPNPSIPSSFSKSPLPSPDSRYQSLLASLHRLCTSHTRASTIHSIARQ